MVKPYLPDIIENCVARVDASFSSRAVDPFNVFFDKGLFGQVRKSVYAAKQNFPLVWFVMKYAEDFNRIKNGIGVYSSATFQLILAMPTQKDYTQQQRDDNSYKFRLLQIYEMLKYEMGREQWFKYNGENGQDHTMIIEPYSAMGEPNGTDQTNLFKDNYYDAISLLFQGVKILELDCAPDGGYDVANPNIYPPAMAQLIFYDDIELIVGGDNEFDPVHETNKVIIPFLVGKNYEVQQRVIGQLRKRRDVEIIPDEDNGGFELTGDAIFNKGDTYIIKIRPAYPV